MKNKKIIASVLATVMSLSFMACGTSKTEAPKNSSEEKKVITMGSSGVYTDMVDIIGKYMSEKGYEIKLVTFDSNSGAADACSANELDAFIFNHEPWIKQYNKDNGTTLKMMNHLYYGRTAMYSKKYSSVAELPDNAVIAIPNDSTNMEQTLLFLQEQGLIKLGEKTESFYTTLDITENPKNISFLEAEITYTAMRIIQGYTYYYGIETNFKMSGLQAVCSESTAYPYMSNHINLSMLCGGTRRYCKWGDDEVSVSIPYTKFALTVEGTLRTIDLQDNNEKKSIVRKKLSMNHMENEFPLHDNFHYCDLPITYQ